MKVEASPRFQAFYGSHAVSIICDSGATSSVIHIDTIRRLGIPIKKCRQDAWQADGKCKLEKCGEVDFTLSRGKIQLRMNAIVVKDLNCEILDGMPFLKGNHISIDIPNGQITIEDRFKIPFSNGSSSDIRSSRIIVRALKTETIFPGDYVDLALPMDNHGKFDCEVVVKPMNLSDPLWPPPQLVKCVDGHIRLVNTNTEPITLHKHNHIAEVLPVDLVLAPSVESIIIQKTVTEQKSPANGKTTTKQLPSKPFSSDISVDPDGLLSPSQSRSFVTLHSEFDGIFNPRIGCYNDASGKIRATINIGKVKPPKCKSHQPQYERKRLSELQDKCDELEDEEVLAKPEDVGVTVHSVSPSFLVNKPSGGSRMVTSFIGIASYARPPPSRASSSDHILLFLAKWPFIITSDMTAQFHQLPLNKESMQYAGIVTPYKGIRVYTRAIMGMPGSTEHLDELMFRVIGDLIHEGVAEKIADDLYVGGTNPEHLLDNWRRVLEAFRKNNLRLKASKTVIAPKSTTVLGWKWNQGEISVSEHKINPIASADPPRTVKALRSWIGAYKHIKSCVPQYSSLLSSVESAVANKDSKEVVVWTDELLQDFRQAQTALKSLKSITIPRSSDHLIVTSDGSIKNNGIGSVLYILRDGKLLLGGYFSMKLSDCEVRWLPCELEALAIGCAVNHWQMYIRESNHVTQLLTDSKPCVQAAKKLARGEYSASARVSTFLNTISRFRVNLQHVAGASPKMLPADYLSRHPITCESKNCQICTFAYDISESVVRGLTVSDVLDRKCPMPFTNKITWIECQNECSDLRRVKLHLSQGSSPSKKATKVRDVKNYLRSCTLSTNPKGLIIHRKITPFCAPLELIVVPRSIVHGLVTALHLRLNHPAFSQLVKVFDRFFFALDASSIIKSITDQCAQCSSLKHLPTELQDFTTSEPAPHPGVSFATDVIRRNRQFILVIRDTFSSFTNAILVPNETAPSLRQGLLRIILMLMSDNGATVRSDNASAFQCLVKDESLVSRGIKIDLGRSKNINKNPVAEKCNKELEEEFCKLKPEGGILSDLDLTIALNVLNSRIRNRGLSAKEILFQRDQFGGSQLSFSDCNFAESQREIRETNHDYSSKCKAPRGRRPEKFDFRVGNLVHLKSERDKNAARPLYIIVSLDSEFLYLRKFSGSCFRSKLYTVKYSDVYLSPTRQSNPILYTSQDDNFYKDINNDDVISDNYVDDRNVPPADTGMNDTNINFQSSSDSEEEEENSDNESDANETIAPVVQEPVRQVSPPRGRGTRRKVKTLWLNNGDYDLG